MLITKEWLKEKSACKEGYEWALKQEGFDDGIEVIRFLDMLVKSNHWSWTNWVITRVLNRTQYLAYAIFSAEQVIDIYEREYPNDDRPRKAIEAAKKVLVSDTKENRDAAANAATAASVAASAANAAAYIAAYSAVYAAYAAAYCSTNAPDVSANAAAAAYCSTNAPDVSANAAAAANYAFYSSNISYVIQKKILGYGISLYLGIQ